MTQCVTEPRPHRTTIVITALLEPAHRTAALLTQRLAEPRPNHTTIVITALPEHDHIAAQGTHPEPACRTAVLP